MSVPRAVAAMVEMVAMIRLRTMASCSPGRPNGLSQASSDSSPQT